MRKSYLLLFLITNVLLGYSQNINFNRESFQTITNYLKEKNIDYNPENIAVLKDFKIFMAYNSNQLLTVPDAYIFNKDGFRVQGFKGTNCGEAIQDLEKINKKKSDKNDNINTWIKRFSFFVDAQNDIDVQGYDFYVVINWAKFLPKDSEISLNWYKSLLKESKYKIKIILLNLDIQDNWVLTDEQKKALKLD